MGGSCCACTSACCCCDGEVVSLDSEEEEEEAVAASAMFLYICCCCCEIWGASVWSVGVGCRVVGFGWEGRGEKEGDIKMCLDEQRVGIARESGEDVKGALNKRIYGIKIKIRRHREQNAHPKNETVSKICLSQYKPRRLCAERKHITKNHKHHTKKKEMPCCLKCTKKHSLPYI